MNHEADFAFRIRQALNDGAERIDYRTQMRLEQARRAALARFDGSSRVRSTGGDAAALEATGVWRWVYRAGLVVPLFALVIGFAGIAEWREAQRISYLADLDFAVLRDDGPLEAYADQGFGAFIQQEQSE